MADRDGAYPFAPFALLLWLPLTVWLTWVAHRAREQWIAPVGYAISILVLLWIGRTFNNYYLVWPMMGAAIAVAGLGGRTGDAHRPVDGRGGPTRQRARRAAALARRRSLRAALVFEPLFSIA